MEKFNNVTNPEQQRETELKKLEQDLNEIIPMLAHGLVRRLEQKGLGGKVRVQSFAGDSWGIAKSPDNVTDIPNVIIYPREALQGDKRMLNALLRHEIGNLNYPIEPEINTLQDWCKTNNIAPQLLTSLVESVHEASVNYLEMRNSHSDSPQENFKALYETEINTEEIARGISKSSPYKQAIDLTLLYSLSYSGLIPKERFEHALESATDEVKKTFEQQTRSILEQAVNTAVPQKQVQLIRDFVWPKFSHLVSASDQENLSKKGNSPNEEYQELLKQVKEMKDKLKENKKGDKKPENKEKSKNKKETPKKKPESKEEQQEKKDAKEDLDKTLKESLEDLKEQLKELSKDTEEKKEKDKSSKEESLSEQAKEAKEDAEKASEKSQDEKTKEKIEKLKEELKQLEELAKELEEDGAVENIEDEPIVYNIKEFGIDESFLTPEQLESLQKVRDFAMQTSVTYRKAMRFVMKAYQKHNPNFTDEIIQKMMDRGYDVPDFSIYGAESAQEFFNTNSELGITEYGQNFLVNFNLPKPLGRFWYKGGNGSKSVPVPEGAVEWGHFYRTTMPAIWNSVDKAAMSGLHLNRINEFGQHDPLNYYYLWEAVNFNQQDQDNKDADFDSENSESEDGEGEEGEKSDESSEKSGGEEGDPEGGEGGGEKEGSGEGKGEGEGEDGQGEGNEGGSGEGKGEGDGDGEGNGEGQGEDEGSGEGKGKGSGKGAGKGQGEGSGESMGGEGDGMSEMLDRLKEMVNSQADSIDSSKLQELQDKISALQESLNSGEKAPDISDQLSDLLGEVSDIFKDGNPEKNDNTEGQAHDSFQKGGDSNSGENLFSKPNDDLLKQLEDAESKLGSKFNTKDQSGNFIPKDFTKKLDEFKKTSAENNPVKSIELNTLEEIKRQQQLKMESMYREMSGLDGEALRVYVDYMESTKDFTEDMVDFFVEKFNLDKEYMRERNQRRGQRLQRGFTRNILGQKDSSLVVNPRSFERKLVPEKPQFAWTLIIDNSGSCGGEIIEQEKRLAVSLTEVAKRLNIPLEIVTFGGPNQFMFLKQFEQDLSGDDLKKTVLLNADQGTPDVVTLDAACASMDKFTNKFKRSYNFLYFMTDGQSGAGSIQEVIGRYKKNMVITGIGLAGAASTISQTWGKNSLEVPDVKKLTDSFIRKMEDQIDTTFD